ncbi:MAG: acyl-CoA synthetase [Panacagrimonas sp.]
MMGATPTSSASAQGPDPTHLWEWFRRRTERDPSNPALTFENRCYSYGELVDEAKRLSCVLASGGVGPGDRVAFVGLNHPVIPIALMATSRLGAIFVPLNFRLTAEELRAVIADAGVHTLIADEEHAAVIDRVREDLGCRRFLRLGSESLGWESLTTRLAERLPVPVAVEGEPGDVAVLMYTSGTTGRPKGVMMSNDNLWFATLGGVLTIDLTSRDVTLICLPLFHAAGLGMLLLPSLMAGAHTILLQGFEPDRVLGELEARRVSLTMLVPTMMLMVSQRARFVAADLSSLRLVIAGAAPVPEPLLKVYAERGIPVSHCYGMTETTSLASSLTASRALDKIGSCGRPTMVMQMRLVDGEGRTITTPGERGEVCLRGRCITRGYWNQPETTALAIRDGWLHSGDVAWFDDEGYFYICDRLKDLIISGGENVYPAEVESVLYGHPAIAQVAVIGVADERWGERVAAVVVRKPEQTLDLEDLRRYAELKLARYKLPSALILVDVLPINSSGKLLKTELRKRYAGTSS